MSLPSPMLLIALLLAICFSFAARLDIWFQGWQGNRGGGKSLLSVLMGDSRRMFANHFFIKADVYFHSGYYPSIFDNNEAFRTAHMAEDAGAVEGKNQGDENTFLGQPLDWIDNVNRHMYPSHHTHLDEGGAHEGEKAVEKGQEREILPWLRLSAELDPQRVETYMVSAFWLRERLGKVNEAEQFLREGLRANPDSFEILYELGRIYDENRKDPQRARHLWELALRKWQAQEPTKAEPDKFLFIQITSHLALLEKREGNLAQALLYMKAWQTHSPHPDEVQKHVDEVNQKLAEQSLNPGPQESK